LSIEVIIMSETMENKQLTKDEAENLRWRELVPEELEAKIPAVHKTVEDLYKAQKVSQKTMQMTIDV